MRKYHGLFKLLLGSYLKFNSNQASAANIPTASPEIFSAGSVNITNFHDLVPNITLPGDIDPAFGLIRVPGGIKLRAVPCLLSTVNFALQLGLDDFEGLIPETAFRLDSHSQVEIAVVPDDESRDIPRKYAIWGLSVGIGTYLSPSLLISFQRRFEQRANSGVFGQSCIPKMNEELITRLRRAILTQDGDT